ncbi:ISYps1 transposase [Edwardsiella anguillarum ET080813]|uniref:ISYps1 transposase n=1 Tax=Edwardsiella anguillarum ET080813 TaxID=667120 RepID=A0A076LGJ8_9GAMM|nr:ISYps1 transposase [Edwardsiella anguillarum ET080813]
MSSHHGAQDSEFIDKNGANTAILVTPNGDSSIDEIITISKGRYLNHLIEQALWNIK